MVRCLLLDYVDPIDIAQFGESLAKPPTDQCRLITGNLPSSSNVVHSSRAC